MSNNTDKSSGRNNLLAIVVGIALAIIFVASVLFVQILFIFFASIILVLVYVELYKVLDYLPVVPLSITGVLLLFGVYYANVYGFVLLFFIFGFLLLLWIVIDNQKLTFLYKASLTFFAYFYISLLICFFVLILQNIGKFYLLFIVLLCVLSDTGGYIFGSKFGKHKISKVISPNKSVEGFVGSLICTVIGSIIYSHYFLQKETFLFAIVFGVISPFIATFGDFCESLIKRDLAVKDMSTMLLGHGGFLDRFDSLLIYAPVFYVIISVHVF